MDIARIPGATRTIGKSQGYLGLPLRDELVHCTVNGPATPSMVTAWMPTPDEIAALMAGAAVHVRILGTAHPPIMLGVGPAGEGEGDAPAPAQEPVAVPAGRDDFIWKVAKFFDEDLTAGSFLREDGEGGFIGGIYRMAREIDRLRSIAAAPVSSPAESGEIVKHAKRLSMYTAALLRHINPTQVSEDFSLQWHAVHDQIDRLQAALASTPAPQPGEPACPHCNGTGQRQDKRTGKNYPCPRCETLSPSPSGWDAGAEAMREDAAKAAERWAKRAQESSRDATAQGRKSRALEWEQAFQELWTLADGIRALPPPTPPAREG